MSTTFYYDCWDFRIVHYNINYLESSQFSPLLTSAIDFQDKGFQYNNFNNISSYHPGPAHANVTAMNTGLNSIYSILNPPSINFFEAQSKYIQHKDKPIAREGLGEA